MTEMDYDAFAQSLNRVMAAFPRFRLQPAKVTELTRTYFDVLKSHAIADVLQAGKTCISKHKQFPAVAEWLAELPPAPPACPADARHMTVAEMDAHDRAHQLRYEDEPCLCCECERAGVMHRPLRFAPRLLADDTYERAYNARTQRLELVGEWLHGEALRRYWAACDHFFALKKPRDLARAVAVITGEREPGSDDQ